MSLKGEVVEYIHLPSGADLPDLVATPRRVVVIVEQPVSSDWQDAVSDWIVKSGCLYMMAWGVECSTWDDSVDYANLALFGFGEIPEDGFVMTTWHDGEPLEEAFGFAVLNAFHPTIELPLLTLLHITLEPRREEILARYEGERAAILNDQGRDVPPTLPRSHIV